GKLTLINNNFHVLANKVITVQNGGELLVSGSISSCGINETWKGIKIETGGRLNVINNLEISNAVNGIQADPNAIINIYGRLNIVGMV
ncbi:MAG: hypothetical protein IPO92_13905, partial [Saprospiraceae bacterium]|nr:hypothetical protein [Saprospiraceae bacterium]